VYCKTSAAAQDRSCGYLPSKAVLAKVAVAAGQDYRDARVKRLIALDPAMGHLVDAASLARIATPVLVVGSVQNDFLPYAAHAGFYAQQLHAERIELTQGEGHFVYLDSCRHQHQALGVSLCQDRAGVNRAQVQQQLAPQLLAFVLKPQH
jgi:predicted dienelactone hydrolase